MKYETSPRLAVILPIDNALPHWREESLRRLVDFSERMRPAMPASADRLRALLAAGEIHDVALGGAMHSLNLNFDRVLLLIGGFIEGGAYRLPPSDFLRGEVAALAELGLVQGARSSQQLGDWSGLTRRGQQIAVYAIYRLLVAAADDAIPHE